MTIQDFFGKNQEGNSGYTYPVGTRVNVFVKY